MGWESCGLVVGGDREGLDHGFGLRVLPRDMASESPEIVGLFWVARFAVIVGEVEDPGDVRALEEWVVGGGDSGGEDS